VLQHPDGSGALCEDCRHLVDRQISNNAQEEDVTLGGSETSEETLDPLGADRSQGLIFGVPDATGEIIERTRIDGPSRPPSAGVQKSEMSDRKDPGTELVAIALEPVQIADDFEKYLPGEVLGLRGPLGSQIADDTWRQFPIERSPRELRATPRGLQGEEKILRHAPDGATKDSRRRPEGAFSPGSYVVPSPRLDPGAKVERDHQGSHEQPECNPPSHLTD
jgi:hypothetical protein